MKRAFITFFACACAISVIAQNNNDSKLLELLKQKNIITQAEVDSLQRVMAEETPMPEPEKKPKFKPSITASGVGHISYQLDRQNGSYTNTFNLVRVCGLVNAEVLRNVRLVGMYYFAPKAIQHMHEFYAKWTPKREIGLSVGVQKVPLSLGNLLSPATIETINPARAVMEVTGGERDITNGTNTGRDLGIEIFGELIHYDTHSLIDYKAGVFNGVGAQAIKDNNKYKDYVAMLFFQPIKGWRIGGSALYGKIGSNSGEYKERTVWNVGTEYDNRFMMIRAEYIGAKNSPTDRKGAYILGMWKACKWADVLAVYDYFKKDITDGTERSNDYMAGINLKFNKMCRLQTFYIFRDSSLPGCDKSTFITQLQVGF